MVEPFEMKAGETRQVFIEMNYDRIDWWSGQSWPMKRDASVVAWGFDGEVTLVHNGGIESTSFPGLPENSDEVEEGEDEESEEEIDE